ncbi:MAG: hypothetical protein R3344_14000, partial [Acidobacteriota bacterium]|nr:hypothetical protein [Acidobacteriota bacterium]
MNLETGEFVKVLEEGSNPRWSPTGHLVFTRRETLLAVPFDPDTLETRGGPVTLADGLRTELADASALFDLARDGTLVYQTGGRVGSRRRVVWVDPESAAVTPWSDDRLAFQPWIRLSPDGRSLATTVMKEDDLLFSVWVSDLERPRLRLWKAMDGLDCNQAVWHPDSRRIGYHCAGATDERGFYIAPVDDSEPPRLLWRYEREGAFATLETAHASGSHFLVNVYTPEGSAVMRVPVETGEEVRSILPHLKTAWVAGLSPDGKWIAYFSSDSGRTELFVAAYSEDGNVGRPTLVAAVPQSHVLWFETNLPDVYELAYLVSPDRAMRVTVRTTPRFSISDPEPKADLTEIRPRLTSVDVAPGGRLLAVQRDEEESGTHRIDLVFHFD